MKTKKIHFRSTSRAVALEPRLLFDGAGAVAAVDGMDDFDFDEQLNDGLVKDVHEAGSEQQSIVNDGDAIEIIDGDDSLHIPSSLGNRLGLEAEQENILAGTEEQSLLIIDSRVDNHELLLESVGSSVTVVVVGEGESGLDAISNALAGSSGYDAIHIISHGTPGSFTLGTDLVDSSSIQQNSEQLQSWANHLNAGADILLYGCDVAQGETGQSFIEQLTAITGADIAASTNATGSAEKGGDWVLERSTGSIEAGVFGFAGYGELLADATFSDTQLPTVPREVSEDATFTLQNFTVAGSGTLSVTITLTEDNKAPASGSFTLGTTTGLAFQTGDGTADTAMTFTGTATDINAALATLTYNPTANFNGAAKLAVVSGGSSKDIAINVTPVNDAPNFAPPAAGDAAVAQVAEEGADSTVTLTPAHFGIDSTSNATLGLFDPDLDPALSTIVNQTPDQIVFEVKNVPGQGRLTGAGNAPLLAGSLFSLQDLKEGKIKYQHFDNEVRADKWANSDKDSFVLTVRDGAGGEMDGTVNIKINPVNDAPSISGSVAGGIIAYEGRNGVPISVTVTDVDQLDENGNWTFTFSDLNLTGSGTRLYLDNDNDGKFSAGDTQINNGSTFTGTQADLNAKLKIDISDAEPTAAISFKVSVTDDGGGEGVGAVKTTTATITINPRENNDHPLLTTNTAPDLGSAYYAGDNVHTITAAQLKTLLGVTDADSPKDTLTYTLVTNVIAESGSTGTVYLLNKDNKYMGSGNSFTQAQLEAGEISIVFTGSGQNTSHFDFQIRDGELTAFSTVKQTEWTPKAIEGSTRDSTDDNYLTHSFYVRFDVPGAGGSGSGPDPANQAPIVGTIVGITANELNESGTTLLYGGTNVGVGKPGIVITDADNADSELTIRLEKVPTGGHIELKVSGSWQTVPLFGSFTYAQLKASEVRYVHDGGEQFLSSNLGFAFSVSDGSALPVTPPIGGDAGSGNNFSVEADPVNDTPSVSASGTGMVLEGGTLTFNTAGNPSISLSDVDGSGDAAPTGLDTWKNDTGVDELYVTVNFTTNTGTPANDLNGKLYYNGTEVANGATLKQSEVQSDKFTYVHDGSENHSGKFTLTVNDAQLKDGTSPHATSVGNTLAVNIQIAPLNDTPSIDPSTPDAPGTAGTLNTGMRLHEGGSGVIAGTNGGSGYASAGIAFKGNTDSSTKSQLVSIDPDNSDTQIQYKILTNTTHGKLSLNGKVLGAGSTFTQADLNNGLVKYTHDASESAGEGIITDKFQFQVGDSGPGTYPKGWFDIEILPANDRPTVEAPSSQPIIVDTTNSGSGVLIKGTGGKTFSVDDVDSVDGAGTKDFLQVTVRLLDEHGDPVPDYTGVTFGYTNQTGGDWAKIKDGNASILQFQGSKTQVNTALAGLTVKFADDRDARYQIEVIVDDRARENDGSLKTADYANGGKYNEPTTPGGSSGAISTAEFDWATNIKVPTTTSADGYGNINSSTVEIWASNENDKPVVAVPGSAVVVHEDKRTPISGITYADPDAFDSTNNTLTLTVSNGTLWFSANESDKSVPGGAGATGVGTASVTLTGSKAQLDAALAQLHYQGDLDFNGIDQIVVIVDDGGNYGKDGTDTSGGSSAGTVTIHILPVNDAPTLTLPNENSYLQVTGASFVLSDSTNPIAIADNKDFSNDLAPSQQDGKDDNFTVTLTLIGTGTNLGTITLDEPGSITTGNNTASVTLTGSRSDINTALAAGVTYSDGGQNIDGTVKLTVTVNDNANGGEALKDPDSKQDGIGGALTDSKILYLQPTDKNDAPSFDGLNNTPTYVQNSNNPVVLDSNATLVDPELDLFGANGNWNGAELTLQRDGGASSYDIFGFTVSGSTGVNVSGSELRIGTTKVGTVTNTNGVLTINFSSNPTAAQVDQVLRAITYSNTDPAPADTVQINYSIRDGNNNIAPTGSDPVGPNGNGQDQGTGGELTGTGSITVKINRQVIAEPDSKTITEGGATTDTTTITGDITPGTTNSNDNGGSQDRDPDADQTIVVQGVKHGTQGSVSAVGTAGVGTTVSGTYGSIVINADGSYTYTLDNTNLAVQALVPDETLTDVFSYAINDSLGANSTTAFSTLTITINGAEDGVTVNVPNTTTQTTPDDVKTGHVVFESGLAGGSSPNANNTIVESSFTILALDGLDPTAAVVIAYNDGSNKTETISKTDLEALSSNTKTITTQYGNLVLNGYSKASDGTITVNYTYTLTQAPTVKGVDTNDSFTITANDRNGDSDGSQTLNIKIVDDAPTATNDTDSVRSGEPKTGNVLSNDSAGADGWKKDGSSNVIAVVDVINSSSTPATTDSNGNLVVSGTYGTLTLQPNGSYTYQANPDVTGTPTDVFTYTVEDADGDQTTATLTITINNSGLALTPGTADVYEKHLADGTDPKAGGAVATGNLPLTSTDTGEHTLTNPTLVGDNGGANKGTVVINGDGTYTYTLTNTENHSGTDPVTDTFTYQAEDQYGNTVTNTVIITIVDDVPEAVNDTVNLGNKLTISGNALQGDTNGAVTDKLGADGAKVTGLAKGNTTGTAITDNTGVAGTGIVGDYGTLILNAYGSYTYTRTDTTVTSATDVFTYTITDKDGDTSTATITINIDNKAPNTPTGPGVDTTTPPNEVDEAGLSEGSNPGVGNKVTGKITFTPGDGVNAYAITTPPGFGDVVITDSTDNGDGTTTIEYEYTLTTPTDKSGDSEDKFTVTITDEDGDKVDAEVTIKIKNDKPTTESDTNDVVEGQSITGNVITNDTPGADGWATNGPVTNIIGGTSSTVTSNSDGSWTVATDKGTLTINPDGSYSYTAKPDVGGDGVKDVFTYTVKDGDGDSTDATLTISISDNTPPEAKPDINEVPEDTPATGNVLANDSDAEDDPLKVKDFTVNGNTYTPGSSVEIPGVGEITLNENGDYIFTPVPDWNGKVPTIDYTVTDGKGGTASSTLDITVTPVKDIEDDSVSTKVDKPITFDPLDNDDFENGDAKITGHTPPANGKVTINPDGTITYTPNPGFIGEDTFEYTVTSGGKTETGTITVKVENQPPVANPDTNVVPEDTPATGNILTNDSDPDGHPVEVQDFTVGGKTYPPGSTVQIPGVGEITIGQNGDYSFTPVPDWNGKVPTIDYTVTDGKGGTASSTLNITVTPAQDIQDDKTSTPAGNPVNVPVLDNDRFSDPNAKVTGTTPPANGTVTINPDGTITYTPNPGFSGEDTFTYTVTTEGGVTETGTVTIVVHPENPPAPAPVPPTDNYQPPGSVGTDKGRDPITGSPVITDPSVFYEGERWNDIRRLPIPLHPVLYVNNQVTSSQLEREQSDQYANGSPDLIRSYRFGANSIGSGLGQDHNLFVSHAIRAAQGTASDLEDRVNGRLARINLSADDLLPVPELRQADPDNMVANQLPEQPRWISQPLVDAEEVDTDGLDGELMTQSVPAGAAPSFTEQLRGGDKRLPMAALNKNFLTN